MMIRNQTLVLLFALLIGLFSLSGATAQQMRMIQITVIADGDGAGNIVSSPAGIACGDIGTQCSATFPAGTAVTLRSRATATGSVFSGWSMAQGSTSSCQEDLKECSFVLVENSVVRATFGVQQNFLDTVRRELQP